MMVLVQQLNWCSKSEPEHTNTLWVSPERCAASIWGSVGGGCAAAQVGKTRVRLRESARLHPLRYTTRGRVLKSDGSPSEESKEERQKKKKWLAWSVHSNLELKFVLYEHGYLSDGKHSVPTWNHLVPFVMQQVHVSFRLISADELWDVGAQRGVLRQANTVTCNQ